MSKVMKTEEIILQSMWSESFEKERFIILYKYNKVIFNIVLKTHVGIFFSK